jgi:hypothetical protein
MILIRNDMKPNAKSTNRRRWSVHSCQILFDFNKQKGTLILLSESVVTWAQNMVAAATPSPRTRRPDKFRV